MRSAQHQNHLEVTIFVALGRCGAPLGDPRRLCCAGEASGVSMAAHAVSGGDLRVRRCSPIGHLEGRHGLP
jgi:hypothetical protein